MRNKIFNKTLKTGVIIIFMAILSCSDDYVRVSPEYSIDSENYFNSEDDYYNALIAAYDMLQSTYVNVILGEIASDNTLCGGESATDVIGWQQVDDMIHTSTNSNLQDIWDWMFAGVQRTNYFMEFKDNIDFDGKETMIAEIRFLRAYYNFELIKWFGAIPLKEDERFNMGDAETVPRSSVEDVYDLIERDLRYACETLDATPENVGRATKGAAQALLGKAYLYQEKYDEAAGIFDTLINVDANYSLADLETLFEEDGENGTESVFEVQYTDVEGADYNCLQCSEGNVAVGFSGVRSYDGPTFTSGFGFNIPVQDAVDEFDDDDLRKDITILDIEAWADSTDATYTEGNEHTGYFNRKYLPRTRSDDAQSDLNLTNPNNYRAIRYADVLLMAAEANNLKTASDDDKAQGYLNEVRRRAFGDEDHDITLTGSALTDAIYAERRLELMGEGHRFFDLVRTGKAADAIDGFEEGKNEIFPIPLEEIQYSNGNWAQNPNY
jgi:tetratricopeptide (TPR) repeat protein